MRFKEQIFEWISSKRIFYFYKEDTFVIFLCKMLFVFIMKGLQNAISFQTSFVSEGTL